MPIPTTELGPGDLARASDPYALLAAVQGQGAVLRSAGRWIVLGHAAAEAVLRSPAARSGFIAEAYRGILPPGAAREEMGHRINFLDPPDHTRVRRLVSKAFTPRRVRALASYISQLCRSLLAPLDAILSVPLVRITARGTARGDHRSTARCGPQCRRATTRSARAASAG